MRCRLVQVTVLLLAAGCLGGPPVVRHPKLAHPVPLVTRDDQRAAFAQAYRLYKDGNSEGALALFTALGTRYPELVDYHLYFGGILNRRRGDAAAATRAFEAVLRDYPRSLTAPASGLELGGLLHRAGRTQEAVPWLTAASAAQDPKLAAAARLEMGQIHEQRGELPAACEEYDAVRRQAVGTETGQTAKQRVMDLRRREPALAPAGPARLDEARLLMREHDEAAAVALIETILLTPPRAGEAPVDTPEVLLLLADALYGSGDVPRSLAVLGNLVDRYPDRAAAPKALFRRAKITWNRADQEDALGLFEEFLRRYPRDGKAAEARYAVGRIHQQAGRAGAAIAAYGDVARRYPGTVLGRESAWRIGWIHYRSGALKAAVDAFRSLASGAARDEADYWRARSLEKAGAAKEAADLYRQIARRDSSGYYGLWAQRRLDGSGGPILPIEPAVVGEPELVVVEPAPFADDFHLQRALELTAAGVSGLARPEWAALATTAGGDVAAQRYLLHAYRAADGHRAAIRLLAKLGARAQLSAEERKRVLYPLAFWSLVHDNAAAQGVDPLLVEAMMRQESVYDPDAVSPVGARGLLQLMPQTARRVAESDPPSARADDLADPEVNIRLGTRYLKSLLVRYGGNPVEAIAAYNAGENAVDRWRNTEAGLEADEFVEGITFRETRQYVKRVVAHYRKYRQLYATPPPAGLGASGAALAAQR